MALDAAGTFDKLVTYASLTGLFDAVITHEPKSAPTLGGFTFAIWFNRMHPTQSSGLNSMSVRLEFQARIYSSMLQEPMDATDVRCLSIAGSLFSALAQGFTLGGAVREVDLFGETGDPLNAIAGYLSQDNKLYRVVDILIPVIVDDIATEVS